MTIASRVLPRQGILNGTPAEPRLFTVAANARLLGHCHWQPDAQAAPTIVLVHGLEGSSGSHYMLGISAKAWRLGFNVVRLNQRNCGGTEHLAATLYHSGLSDDILAVMEDLIHRQGLRSIWIVGYSMGGNLVLRAAGHIGSSLSALKGVVAVAPTIDPAVCVDALERLENRMYQHFFLRRLAQRLRRKAELSPGIWDVGRLSRIRTLREFDEQYTAPDGGFRNAAEYYERVGARHVLHTIRVPTLIIASQDDPFVPYRIFDRPELTANRQLTLWTTRSGGHCAFLQRPWGTEDAYWAENRITELVAAQADVPRPRMVSATSITGPRSLPSPPGGRERGWGEWMPVVLFSEFLGHHGREEGWRS